jgi:adenosyl cobinamide kinase/adenosyl cobinamide phosphate guanylyltransferase
MVHGRDVGLTLAPPVPPSDSTETTARSNIDHEQKVAKDNKTNSKLLLAFSTDCMALEKIAHEFEARDEQEQATDEPGIIDLEYRNNQNDGIETVLSILDKNLSSANAFNHGSHKLTHSYSGKKYKHKCKNAVAVIPSWTIGSAVDEFLRVHNCEPLLQSDDESENESCYSRGMESQASCRRPPVEGSCTVEKGRKREQDEDEDKNKYNLEVKVVSLQAQLDASRETISSLENQLNSQVPSPTQITQLVNQRREVEELAVEKKVLEAQLVSTQQQLVDARQDAMNAAAENRHLQRENRRLEDELLELRRNNDPFDQILSEINSTSKEVCDPPTSSKDKFNIDTSTIQQLRLDLHEAHSVIKRMEKDRARERKHYHRLMEGASIDLDTRIKTEMDNNLEMRRKCYVFEQKLNAKKKTVIDLQSELNRMADELDAKDREKETLLHQVDHLKKLLRDDERQTVEMDCLQDINESLNEELATSLEVNKRLKEQLRRLKKVTSHKILRTVVNGTEVSDAFIPQDDVSNYTRTVVTNLANTDVFAKAVEYLNGLESERNLPLSVVDQTKVVVVNTEEAQEITQPQEIAAGIDNEQAMLQKSRKRFESLRSEFYGK